MYSSKTEARSREHEAPSDGTRRPVEEPVREDSVLIMHDTHPQRALPEDGRGEKSKTPDQGASRSNPALELPAREWIGRIRKLREDKEQYINRALQREAHGSLSDQERYTVEGEYSQALEEEIRKYAGKDHK